MVLSEDDKELVAVGRSVLKFDWKEEAKKVPLDNLELDEIAIIRKCINEEDFEDEEIIKLNSILQSYRNVIKYNNLEKVEENIKLNKKLIKTEQSILDKIERFKKQRFIFNLPLGDETLELEFKVIPIENSKQIESLQYQIGIFDDFSDKEKEIIKKNQMNHRLDKREQAILDGLNEKFTKALDENEDNLIINVLANQLIMHDESGAKSDLKDRKMFWRAIPAGYRTAAFMKVKDLIGLADYENRNLFRFR